MVAPYDVISRKLAAHSNLAPGDLDMLRSLPSQSRSLQPNEDVIRQGDKPHVAALVMAGMVARYHTLSSGRRQYLSFHMTGDMPDAQSLFIERMDHSVCALGPVQLALIPHENVLEAF